MVLKPLTEAELTAFKLREMGDELYRQADTLLNTYGQKPEPTKNSKNTFKLTKIKLPPIGG